MAGVTRTITTMVVAAGIGAGSVFALSSPEGRTVLSQLGSQVVAITGSPDCRIKGNVSIETGERIYHVPGQRYYDGTRVDPSYGERWFCTEAEARSAGWRKSRA